MCEQNIITRFLVWAMANDYKVETWKEGDRYFVRLFCLKAQANVYTSSSGFLNVSMWNVGAWTPTNDDWAQALRENISTLNRDGVTYPG